MLFRVPIATFGSISLDITNETNVELAFYLKKKNR